MGWLMAVAISQAPSLSGARAKRRKPAHEGPSIPTRITIHIIGFLVALHGGAERSPDAAEPSCSRIIDPRQFIAAP